MSHPGVGLDKWEDLPSAKPVYLGAAAITTFYAWLKLEYGFKDENIRPYNFNSAPFIANKNSIQQGYVTGEPFEIERQGHFMPNLFLLSDYGYDTYATLIVTRAEIVEEETRSRSALRRRLSDRLVSLSLRRQFQGERADQSGQPRPYRRLHRLFDRGDEEVRHRQLRRRAQARHRRDDRRALEGLFRKNGGDPDDRQAHRLQERIHPAIHQQKDRGRSPSSVMAREELIHVAHPLALSVALQGWPTNALAADRDDQAEA